MAGEADERTLAMQRARWARATSGVGVKAEKDDREGMKPGMHLPECISCVNGCGRE